MSNATQQEVDRLRAQANQGRRLAKELSSGDMRRLLDFAAELERRAMDLDPRERLADAERKALSRIIPVPLYEVPLEAVRFHYRAEPSRNAW